MDSWPAQSLCTGMAGDAAFSLVLGDYCDPECFFGTKNGACFQQFHSLILSSQLNKPNNRLLLVY
jgi:hypothetical protein